MKLKKLLLVSGLCLANFCAFADVESELVETDCTENNYSENADTAESASWWDCYPTYAQVRIGVGPGSKFNYVKEMENVEDEIDRDAFKKGVTQVQIGLEIGKIVDEWRFGVELGGFHGSVKTIQDPEDGQDMMSVSMNGLMLLGNAYYTIPLTEEKEWSLVLGAGLGIDIIRFSLDDKERDPNTTTKDSTCFAAVCQGYMGLAYDVNKNVTVNVGYRLHKLLNDIEWTSYEYNDAGETCKVKSGWGNVWVHTFECSLMGRFE